ncbi:PREDICTED: phosphatidylinositol 4,5-bisphosphate 3-kinase catalytic subunit beta isoform-like [Amphimedon queenslandica]|uniref:PIK helical domain-containing protein n=1 Tax=Amphimedon queenslandica TaxID=400682 RepID=A0AAN0JTE9_AMPQE|nr:PREDICTED: phosphatidylinositol 4,5-bisphosphate 3-kinase catalytic subunit beta isoform-like [Amphimedon queenslandica]|eukprot:XP_019860158.1 PREDICTED: phosphatidylinositol 4,5-bisphosphate 3-kinase catalytic subunit beta isoform-like [Amphimedon queenslandica]
MEKVLELASKEMTNYKEERVAKTYEQELNDIVERDPLAPLYEQDKTLIWRFRMYLLENLPSSLPKLLNSVKWYQHRDVAVVSILTIYMYMQCLDLEEFKRILVPHIWSWSPIFCLLSSPVLVS